MTIFFCCVDEKSILCFFFIFVKEKEPTKIKMHSIHSFIFDNHHDF
jgi:hypothetical protein